MILTLWYSTGWVPGTPVATPSADPTVTPDPTNVISGVVPQIRAALLSSGGAALLVAAGVLVLMKGIELMIGQIKARRSPKQLTLF